MKKLISIFLLVCLIAPVGGTYIWLKYEKMMTRKEVKRQMIAGMVRNKLVLLKFTRAKADSELKWKHSKEFEYRSEMYDVVETQKKGDEIIYWCWWDNKESKLNKQLTDILNNVYGNDPVNKETHKRLVNFYKSLINHDILDWNPVWGLPISEKLSDIVNLNYNDNCPATRVPPPEMV